jgi:hypothetical protein
MPADILIVPNRGSSTLNPVIQFSGSAANTIRLEALQSGSVAFLGNSGSLFSIVDSMSGSLMAVSDISGLPILEVFSDDRVVAGKYNSNALVVTGSRVGIGKATPSPSVALDVTGSAFITGSLNVSSTFSSNALWTVASALSYWGGYPTVYGVLTWDTGYASVAASTGNKLYLSANGSTTTGHMIITTGGDVTINKTTAANGKLDVNGNFTATGSALITGSLSVTGSVSVSGSLTTTRDATINNLRVGRGPSGLSNCVSVGVNAGNSTVTGDVTAIGFNAAALIGGYRNTAVGSYALYANTSQGNGSTAIGVYSMGNGTYPMTLTDGGYNTAVGYFSLYLVTSSYNVAIGSNAGYNIAGGSLNTFVGNEAGKGVTNGTGNTIIGGYSTSTTTGITFGNYNTIIGGGVSGLNGALSNNIMLADGQGNIRYICDSSGNTAIGKTTPINAVFDINGNTIITGSLTVTGNINGTVVASAPDFAPIFLMMGA